VSFCSLTGVHRLLLTLVASTLLLGGCQHLHESDTAIIQPDTDQRAMRHLTLDNGLQVLLISDPTADKAAAALDVNVGSRQDPPGREGLAHFLEHMLFLGTERYPDAGEYQRFISAHGGSHNAYTAFEHTNYFFDIHHAHLEGALDRFSQFFVAPLFTAEFVEREKNAVHSEYLARIRDDQRRSLDALRAVVNPAHPFHGFSVGSLETLADRPESTVREELLAFYERHYSANQMTLVVLGRESLDALEAMVVPRFADVRNHGVEPEPITAPLFEQGGVRIDIQSINQQHVLSFGWPMPDQHADWRSKPLSYIGNILGHEGEGSLLSWLKAQGWASGLSAGIGFEYQGGALMSVSIDLTRSGVDHIDEITTALYQTIAMIRDGGIVEWMYTEQQRVAEQRFRFREEAPPIREVSRFATALHDYPPAEVIRGDYLMEAFQRDRIVELLALMTPERMVMTFLSPEVETDRISPWYQTPYRVRALPADQLARWAAPAMPGPTRLPDPNPFIAESLTLKPLEQPQTRPALLEQTAGLQLWHLQEPIFRLPRGNVMIDLHLPAAGGSARQAVLGELWARMVRESLNEYAYPAFLAGLSYRISASPDGFELRVQGFAEKQEHLLHEVLRALRAPALEQTVFERVRNDYQRQLQDRINAPPYQLLLEDLPVLLGRDRWPVPALIEAIETVDLAALQQYGAELWRSGSADMLVHGNYLADEARALGQLVRDELLASIPPAEVAPKLVLDLGEDEIFRWQLPSPHADAALLWYRQADQFDKPSRAAMGVTAQLLSADFFNDLRTQQQLGYVVMSSAYPVREVPGLVFLVQSPVAGPAELAAAFATFMKRWAETPSAQLQPLFERHRDTLARRLAEAPDSLNEASERLWRDLQSGYLAFDSREQILAAVTALDFDSWYQLFQRDVLAPAVRELWLESIGQFEDTALTAGQPVDELQTFRQQRDYVAFPAAAPAR
jgi:secreted Zn-dependent insulinase-like peptidase